MSLVSNALQIAHAAQQVLHGEAITYARGESISIEMENVIQGRTEWKGSGPGGLVVISESVDFLIPVSVLVDDAGDEIEPAQFDKLTTDDGYTYDVQPFGPDDLLWRWHDRADRTVRRIFCKLYSEPD
ncbi:MAG: hypothetical protein Fues2KO_47130 [Fuerstiella sp.]